MALKEASEVPVTVEVDVDAIGESGSAIAVWDAVLRRDQPGGSLVLDLVGPHAVVTSAIPLVIHLLRSAGHHHRDAHDEVRHHLLAPDAEPFTEPWLSTPCDEWCDKTDACACDVETAGRLLAGVVEDTPAAHLLSQVVDQFSSDRRRTRLALMDVTVLQTTVLIEAAALFLAHRRHCEACEVFDSTRAAVLAANIRPDPAGAP